MADIFATLRGLVGKRAYASDNEVNFRAGRGGQMIGDYLNGPYYQGAKDEQLYHACTTTNAGVAHNVDAEGTVWDIVLRNPSGSGVDAVIIEARCGRGTTGDIGPGVVLWMRAGADTSTTPTGTTMEITGGRVSANAGNQCVPLEAVTVEATDGVRMRIAFELDESLLATAGGDAVHQPAIDRVDGQIIVPPGWYVGLTGEGDAGASPLLQYSLTWKEVPI